MATSRRRKRKLNMILLVHTMLTLEQEEFQQKALVGCIRAKTIENTIITKDCCNQCSFIYLCINDTHSLTNMDSCWPLPESIGLLYIHDRNSQ